jgi:hypothetical protein
MKIMNHTYLLLAVLGALVLAPRAAAQSISGWVPAGHFGWSIGAAGDVNGDGLADVIVGAPDTVNPSTGAQTGAAFVYTAAGTLLYTWYGSPGDSFGFSVAGAGDVNGDGRPDLIVGSPNASPSGYLHAGRATVFSGANGGVLFTLSSVVPEQHLGYSVAGAGYVNADGFADVIVGTNDLGSGSGTGTFPGAATVASGPAGVMLYTWFGDYNASGFGNAVAGAGDVNGDGRADLVVGSPAAGIARVFSGANGLELYTLTSAFPGSSFGWSVASAGDVTGDGRADVIIGQPQGTITGLVRGTAQVFDGSSQALVQGWEGDAGGDMFGFAVASAGDVDRDGRADLLVGVPGDDTWPGGSDGGGVRVFSGRTGLRLFSLWQGGTGAQGGYSVAGLGNAAGGSELEFAYGVPHASWNAPDAGGVWIYSMPSIFRFALGDGTGTQCPCGNGTPGSGCANPASALGGRLDACGNTSVSADWLVLAASGLPNSAAVFFQGTTQTNNGLGTPFGAGIRGVGGSIVRLGVKFPASGGAWGPCAGALGDNGGGRAVYPDAGDPAISLRGMVPPAGGSRNYQVWYRTAPACNGATTNWTNGIEVAWGP